MLYTEDFSMRHYVGFLQIQSQMFLKFVYIKPSYVVQLTNHINNFKNVAALFIKDF